MLIKKTVNFLFFQKSNQIKSNQKIRRKFKNYSNSSDNQTNHQKTENESDYFYFIFLHGASKIVKTINDFFQGWANQPTIIKTKQTQNQKRKWKGIKMGMVNEE